MCVCVCERERERQTDRINQRIQLQSATSNKNKGLHQVNNVQQLKLYNFTKTLQFLKTTAPLSFPMLIIHVNQVTNKV